MLDSFAQTVWIVCIDGTQNLPKLYGFDSQSVQTKQLRKEFLDPGLNSWGCERGGRKKPTAQHTCARPLWNPGLQYITFHC